MNFFFNNNGKQPVSFVSAIDIHSGRVQPGADIDILSGRLQPGADPEESDPKSDSLGIHYVRPNVVTQTSTRVQNRAETALAKLSQPSVFESSSCCKKLRCSTKPEVNRFMEQDRISFHGMVSIFERYVMRLMLR